MRNKKIVKKLKLKESVKNALIIIGGLALVTTFLIIASNRIENIENNPNAYNNRAVSVNVHPNYK